MGGHESLETDGPGYFEQHFDGPIRVNEMDAVSSAIARELSIWCAQAGRQ